MSIKSELTVLKTNIQNAKNKLYSNLTDKGVTTITTASTLDAMADSVSNITVGEGGSEGGNSFSVIGYTSAPKYIQDGIDYGQTIYNNWDASITDRSKAFSGDTQLVYFPLVDTSNVTNMDYMFYGCKSLQHLPSINTSNVTNMGYMFYGCSALASLDLSSLDTSKVTSMYYMFNSCSKLTSLDLSNWNTSNVIDMMYMFANCSSLASLDLSSFDTSNVTDMDYMFNSCSKLTSLDLSNWNTSNVTGMSNMFANCSSLASLDLSSFDTRNVTSMMSMFSSCSGLTSLDLSSFDTTNVTAMTYMFDGCSGLTSLDLSSITIPSGVTTMSSMFEDCRSLISLDLSSFDTRNVTSMNKMFYNCYKLQRIDGYLDWSKIATYPSNFISSSSTYKYPLRYLTFKNIGKTGTTFNFSNTNLQNWGDETDTTTYPLSVGARQSLIDSLLTYSYDRASNGMSSCTIQLYSTVKARLTDDEIAAITAKGFTIA